MKPYSRAKEQNRRKIFSIWLLTIVLLFSACADVNSQTQAAEVTGLEVESEAPDSEKSIEPTVAMVVSEDYADWYENIPPYEGNASVIINNGIPFFEVEDLTTEVFEEYSDLDEMERCGVAYANVCQEIMPTEERGSIGNVRPTGWHTVKYDVIADRYLYNRCHLIGYQLAGENADERNLITGTRYLNVDGMLPWENLVAGYAQETGNHVLYRVTPYFEGENLVASGVLIEAFSVEDNGEGICFNVYCYNVQPGILIDYATGESYLDESWSVEEKKQEQEYDYVLNKNTKKFHDPSCESVQDMSDKNKEYLVGDREEIIEKGYSPCKRCDP